MIQPIYPIEDAIILAAGRGTRLGENGTATHCKAMVRLAPEETTIKYQLRQLRAYGIRRVTVISGFAAEELIQHLEGEDTEIIHNAVFAETNSLYSLSLASEALRRGSLILNSDVLFHPEILGLLLNDPAPNALLVDTKRSLGEEEMKVRIGRGGVVEAIAKTLIPEPGMGENLGILKMGAAHATAILAEMELILATERRTAWAPSVIHRLVGRVPFHAINIGDLAWTEIDFPEDLKFAREVIYPLCRKAEEARAAV